MKTVKVVYQVKTLLTEEVRVPDDFDFDNDQHFQDLFNQLNPVAAMMQAHFADEPQVEEEDILELSM